MTRREKLIAGFLLFQASAGLITFASTAVAQGGLPWSLAVLIPPIIAAAVAGVGAFQRRRWAWPLAALVFAVQLLSFKTPWFFYSVWLGIHLAIAFGWIGSGQVGINLVAVAMLVLLAARGRTPNNSSKPTPLRGAA